MQGEYLYGLNGSLIFALLLILFYGSVELGAFLGKRSSNAASKEVESHVATIEAALLGLLALLLGFGFSMAMTRFESRRAVVVSEANDIGTAYLRAGLLPSYIKEASQNLLIKYVDSRIAFFQAGLDTSASQQALKLTEQLQAELWEQAIAVAKSDSPNVIGGLFIAALNELIDVHTDRMAALENHVPEIILILLVFVGAATLALTGYRSGLSGIRLPIPRFILVILIVSTLSVIIDLDRPRRGFIKVSESALLQLKSSMTHSQ